MFKISKNLLMAHPVSIVAAYIEDSGTYMYKPIFEQKKTSSS